LKQENKIVAYRIIVIGIFVIYFHRGQWLLWKRDSG